MVGLCIDVGRLSKFVHHSANAELTVSVRQHVQYCVRCRDHLTLMQRFADSLFDDMHSVQDAMSPECCPTAIQLQHFFQENLSDRQMVRLQLHLGGCVSCQAQVHSRSAGPSLNQPETPRPALRRADLDVRWTPEGLLFAEGSDFLDTRPQPTLVERLRLPIMLTRKPPLLSSRFFHFALPHRRLRGRFQLHSPEAFSLRLDVTSTSEHSLQIWTRSMAGQRRVIRDGFWESGMLLPRGYYFFGPDSARQPWLALSLEENVATLQQLAWLGWDHGLHGRFHSAACCLGKWAKQDSAAEAPARHYRNCRELAAAHDMAQADKPLMLTDRSSRQRFAKAYVNFLTQLQESLPETP